MGWEDEANQTWAQQQIANSFDKFGEDAAKSLSSIKDDIAEIKKRGTRNTIIGSIIGTFVGVLAGYFSVVIIELLKKVQ